MDTTRRGFIGAAAAGFGFAAAGGCRHLCRSCRPGKVALQLYSIRQYIDKAGMAKTLEEVAKIGYEGVEFAGYRNHSPAELRKMLDDSGLAAVGTHVDNKEFGFDTRNWTVDPEVLKRTCEFNLGYGNSLIICPGGGNMPPSASWSAGMDGGKKPLSAAGADFVKRLCDLYNKGAGLAKTMGCKIGIHNHTVEHAMLMPDGVSYWDYFFTNTSRDVCMEQDVGWTVCAGVDPVEQYAKYPGRSPSLHAKENGMGPGVKEFDAILGRPGRPGGKGVDWDSLFKATDADGVEWYIVECERHSDSFKAIVPSFEFLKSKGRV